MKETIRTIKWMASQIRSFWLQLIIIGVTSTLLSLFNVGIALASKNLIDAAYAMDKVMLVYAAITFAALILLETGTSAYDSYLSVRTSELISNKMRENLFKRLSLTYWHKISKYHSDDILTRMTSDIDIVTKTITSTLPSVLSLGVMLVAAFIALFSFDPVLALLAFALGPATVLSSRFFAKKLRHIHIEVQEADARSRGFIHEAIQNILIIKAFCLERRSLSHISKLQNEKLGWIIKKNKTSIWANALLSLGYWSSYLLAFGWGSYRLTKGMITFGMLVAFLQLVDHVQSPFSGLAHALPQIISSIASIGRIIEFEEMEQEESNKPVPVWSKYGIQFENVKFGYEKDSTILKDTSFEIHPGETVCLIGSSGEGKTTVLRLMLSLLRPGSGHVYLTGDSGSRLDMNAPSRNLISYVPQGNTLFSGTIADNLRMGNETASDMELEAAARSAEAWEFISSLPDGLNTEIGERGTGLSEGQAQRLAITRALLHKAPILILDEATSSLDMKTEIKILNTIKRLNPAKTCIIVTHRTTAMEICNRVIKLEDGEITLTSS